MANLVDATLQFFFEEAADHLQTLEAGLLRLEKDPHSLASTIEELLRAAHTLKGSAALMKQKAVSQVAHHLEDALEAVLQNQKDISRHQVDNMLAALDRIRELLAAATAGKDQPEGDPAEDPAAGGAPASSGTHPAARPAGSAPNPALPLPGGGAVKVAFGNLEAMMNLLGEFTVAKTHLVNQLGVMRRLEDEIEFAGQKLLKEVGNFSEHHAYALPEQPRQVDALIGEFQDLEFDRYDELNLFSRKLQEITNDIHEALQSMDGFFGGFADGVESMDRMIVAMKERVSEARTVPASSLFQRFTRAIRELSAQSGKEIELVVSGGDNPIDRVIFDELYAPLLHIIRNAVSHGFEPTTERLRLGKAAKGTIWLTARRQGSTIDIEVRDDGRGVQLEKVRQRAVEKGFLQSDTQIEGRDLLQMIFRTGFSTADRADDSSGRGVGMSVVMDRLAALSGTIDIATDPGQGTTVRMSMPLSLVIINVIQFRVGRQLFVIPTNQVAEIIDLPFGAKASETLLHREQTIPALELRGAFGLPREEPERLFALVTQAEGKKVALLVDEILSQEDTVIRPFGAFLRQIPHLAGTCIAGDGTLRLVLNPSRILSHTQGVQNSNIEAPAPAIAEKPTVLVVDDSLSVRKHAGMILESAGMQVITSTNGFEALEVLDAQAVNFIITDLEMPLMHGYALLGELKRRGTLETMPTAVLSSRAGKQHQDKAFALGACDYLVKPFEEQTLVSLVRRHLPPPPSVQ